MPTPALSQIRNMPDLSALYRWELIFSVFPTAVGGFNSEELNLRCESIELPKRTVTPVEIFLHGHKNKRPGRSEVPGTLAFTFVETVDAQVLSFIKAWRDAIWAPDTGVQASYADLIATIEIHHHDAANDTFYRYVLKGCWLEDYEGGGTPDGQTGDPLKPLLTIAYDDFDDFVVS